MSSAVVEKIVESIDVRDVAPQPDAIDPARARYKFRVSHGNDTLDIVAENDREAWALFCDSMGKYPDPSSGLVRLLNATGSGADSAAIADFNDLAHRVYIGQQIDVGELARVLSASGKTFEDLGAETTQFRKKALNELADAQSQLAAVEGEIAAVVAEKKKAVAKLKSFQTDTQQQLAALSEAAAAIERVQVEKSERQRNLAQYIANQKRTLKI